MPPPSPTPAPTSPSPLISTRPCSFTRHSDQFLLAVEKYSLHDHVLRDTPVPSYPDWQRMDCVVKSWILGTISDDLAETISGQHSTAHS